jgi:hypothetical protein
VNRTLISLLAALEAFIAVAIGIGISLVPLTLMWAAQPDLEIGWDVYWRASADIWLVGHGVDLTMTLSPELAAAVALPGAEIPFLVSIAPLSFALVTALYGVRLGRKSVESGARFIGPLAAVITFGVLTIAIALSAVNASVMPTAWMAFSFPTAIFALGVFIGARGEIGHVGGATEKVQRKVKDLAGQISDQLRIVLATALRGGLIVVAAIVGFSAVALAVLVIANFSTILGIYQGLQGGGGGSLVVTAAQLMFMPNFVLWVAAWFIGAGFAIGAGSLVSPLGADLGLVPALPILGAIPPGQPAIGLFAIVIPVVIAFATAFFLRPRLIRSIGVAHELRWSAATVAGMALVAGIVMAFLSWASSGAAGPGRLADVGPNPWITGGLIAAECLVAGALGMWASSQTRFGILGSSSEKTASR